MVFKEKLHFLQVLWKQLLLPTFTDRLIQDVYHMILIRHTIAIHGAYEQLRAKQHSN